MTVPWVVTAGRAPLDNVPQPALSQRLLEAMGLPTLGTKEPTVGHKQQSMA